MTRKAVLMFGGPGLPEGSRTWYETPAGAIVQAFPGDEVDADQVLDLEGYLTREQASLREPAADWTLTERSPDATGDERT